MLALGTLGSGSDATTTWAPGAAQVTPWDEQGEGSPEAMQPRMNQRALALLQDRSRQALANVPSRAKVGAAGLLTYVRQVSRADRTGCELPESLQDLLPGAGGSAAKAGANIQAVGDSTSRVCGPCALTPWNMPDQQAVDPVVA